MQIPRLRYHVSNMFVVRYIDISCIYIYHSKFPRLYIYYIILYTHSNINNGAYLQASRTFCHGLNWRPRSTAVPPCPVFSGAHPGAAVFGDI